MRARGGRARATRLTRGQGRRRTAAAAAAAGLVERVEHAESACRFGLGERTGHGECTPVLGAEHRGRADACVARAARLLHGLLNARRLGGMPSAAPSSLDARQRWPEAPPPPAAPPQWQPCLANALPPNSYLKPHLVLWLPLCLQARPAASRERLPAGWHHSSGTGGPSKLRSLPCLRAPFWRL